MKKYACTYVYNNVAARLLHATALQIMSFIQCNSAVKGEEIVGKRICVYIHTQIYVRTYIHTLLGNKSTYVLQIVSNSQIK